MLKCELSANLNTLLRGLCSVYTVRGSNFSHQNAHASSPVDSVMKTELSAKRRQACFDWSLDTTTVLLLCGGYTLVSLFYGYEQCSFSVLKVLKMSEEVVNSASDVRKRRKSGEGCLKTYNKKLKSEGKAYTSSNNQTVPAKIPPKEEVCIEQLGRPTTVILVNIKIYFSVNLLLYNKAICRVSKQKVLRGAKT